MAAADIHIDLGVRILIIAYLLFVVVLWIVVIPVVPLMLLFTYLHDGTLELPHDPEEFK